MTSRLFIALHIPDFILDAIIEARDEIYPADKNIRWEPKSKLHITLKFLGDVETDNIDYITSSLKEIVEEHSRIKLSFSKFGMFYFKKNPRILWLGLNYSEELNSLHKRIDERLAEIGFERDERKFKPHLTLLRVRGREDNYSLMKFLKTKVNFPDFEASEISLIKSELKSGGSVYTIVKRLYLK